MPEQLQKILDKVVEWWKKFNNKQRTILVSVTAVIVLSLAILAFVVSRPTMVPLITCETVQEAAEVKEILDSDSSINYTITNNVIFEVAAEDEVTACMLLASNDIPSDGYGIENVTSGGFSTTESDKQKLYQKYLEEKFEKALESLEFVNSADVSITIPKDDGTIISSQEPSTAAVRLDLKRGIDDEQAYSLAQFVATQLGNDSTEGVTIIDSKSNMIYSGSDATTSAGMSATQLSFKQKQENMIKTEIQQALMGTGVFADISIGLNLDINFDLVETETREYYYPDGQTSGAVLSRQDYESESYNGSGAPPGTDSNSDNTSYVVEDNEYTHTTITDSDIEYQNNEKTIKEFSNGGKINYTDSSISVVATKKVIYDEAQLKATGQLEGITFDEFIATHSDVVMVEVDESFYEMVSKATGFSVDNISILCHEQPEFVPIDSTLPSLSEIAQIVLAILIFVLLGVVVFISTRKPKEEEMEPELSVEALLQATGESKDVLEDIGYSEKSETRLLIEKFVDENPDAVALLLRNWLSDDWE